MENTIRKATSQRIATASDRAAGKRQKARLVPGVLLPFTCLALLAVSCNESGESLRTTARPSDAPSVDSVMSEAIRIVRQGLADNDPRVRANAIEVVAATKTIPLMPKVHRLLQDEFVPVRFLAVLAVGDLQYALAQEQLKQLLTDADENIRIAAAYALARLGQPGYMKVFRNAIASNDQTVRANAALLLGKTGDPSPLTQQVLWWTLQRTDSNDKVRFQAAEALAMLGDERVYPKLWAMLISAYADDRVVGIRAMGALGTEQAKNALITTLDDSVLEVRLAAAEQLGRLNDPIGEPEVLEVFTKNLTVGLDKPALERVNVLTALAIGQIGTDRLAEYLPRLLKDESKFVRIAAAKAVIQRVTRK
jgi:HEAT repeat protein